MTASPSPPALVHVAPLGADIAVNAGETLFEAAWRQGYKWPTRCSGQAQCTLCVLELVDGAENALPPEAEEAAALQRVRSFSGRPGHLRLACRLKLCGAVSVRKDGVARA